MSLSLVVEHRRDAASPRAQLRTARRRRLLQQDVAGAPRRQLGLGVVQEEIAGDLVNAGYFSAQLLVGTPPQPFSLIVDTGSSVTAIPCTGCRECGVHSNPRFEPARSQTFERLGCDASAGYYCASCDAASECGYRVAYQEGSSYSGYLALDTIRVGQGGACVQLEFPFGCSTEETGLFTSQQADGIMGLASSRRRGEPSNPTVLEALVAARIVPDAFSLCFGAAHGVLTFGVLPDAADAAAGAAGAAAADARFWTTIVDSSFYGIEVLALTLGTTGLARAAPPSSTIVDSGTTFMYMHSAAFVPLLSAMRAAPIHHGCTNVRQIDAPKDEYCARIDAPPPHVAAGGKSAAAAFFSSVLDGCYDPLTVTLRTGALSIAPSRYFYESDQGPGEFCLGVFDNYEDSLVLGAMNMIDHEVVFDRAGGRIGFSRRNCSAAASALAATGAGGNASLRAVDRGLERVATSERDAITPLAERDNGLATCTAVGPGWAAGFALGRAGGVGRGGGVAALVILLAVGLACGFAMLELGRRCGRGGGGAKVASREGRRGREARGPSAKARGGAKDGVDADEQDETSSEQGLLEQSGA